MTSLDAEDKKDVGSRSCVRWIPPNSFYLCKTGMYQGMLLVPSALHAICTREIALKNYEYKACDTIFEPSLLWLDNRDPLICFFSLFSMINLELPFFSQLSLWTMQNREWYHCSSFMFIYRAMFIQCSVSHRERLKYMFRPSTINVQDLVKLGIIAVNKRTVIVPRT